VIATWSLLLEERCDLAVGQTSHAPSHLYCGAQCYKVAAVIQQIQQYQQTPYNLAVVPAIREFLLAINPLTDEECWSLSVALKPLGS
jgi:hypothetical protein